MSRCCTSGLEIRFIVLETRWAKAESFETQGRRYSGTAFLTMNWSSLVAVGPM
jgi:hypothetical protein